MEITVTNQQKRVPLNPAKIKKILRKILRHKGVTEGSLSLVFVTDQKIQSIHKKYLKRNTPTDVITFDLREGRKRKGVMEGEIVISAQTAFRQAKEYGTTPFEELVLYAVHGVLHLLGYDDHSPADIKRMRAQESKLMKLAGMR